MCLCELVARFFWVSVQSFFFFLSFLHTKKDIGFLFSFSPDRRYKSPLFFCLIYSGSSSKSIYLSRPQKCFLFSFSPSFLYLCFGFIDLLFYFLVSTTFFFFFCFSLLPTLLTIAVWTTFSGFAKKKKREKTARSNNKKHFSLSFFFPLILAANTKGKKK